MKTKSNRSRAMACAPLLVVLLGSVDGLLLEFKISGGWRPGHAGKTNQLKTQQRVVGHSPAGIGKQILSQDWLLPGRRSARSICNTTSGTVMDWKAVAGAVVQAAENTARQGPLAADEHGGGCE